MCVVLKLMADNLPKESQGSSSGSGGGASGGGSSSPSPGLYRSWEQLFTGEEKGRVRRCGKGEVGCGDGAGGGNTSQLSGGFYRS